MGHPIGSASTDWIGRKHSKKSWLWRMYLFWPWNPMVSMQFGGFMLFTMFADRKGLKQRECPAKYWQIRKLHEKLAKQRRAALYSEIGWHVWNQVGRSAKCGFLAASRRSALGCSQWLLGGEITLPNPKFKFNFFSSSSHLFAVCAELFLAKKAV